MAKWLKQFLAERGVTQSELARLLAQQTGREVPRQYVNRWLKEGVPKEWAAELSVVLGVSVSAILYGPRGIDENTNDLRQLNSTDVAGKSFDAAPPVRYLTVVGEAAAGRWLDVSAMDFTPYSEGVSIDPRWPDGTIYGYVIRGTSLNKKAQDGDVATVVLFEAFGRDIRSGDFVLVERTRKSTHQVELTIKVVGRSRSGAWLLQPHSTDPRHQEPLQLGEDDDEIIRVLGFVINFVSPGTRP